MEKLYSFIDRYLVPLYQREGLKGTLLVVALLLLFVGLAFYVGLGGIITEFLK